MREGDPVARLKGYLLSHKLLTEAHDKEILRKAQEDVDAATEEVERAPYPDPSTLMAHVYEEPVSKDGRNAD